MDGQWTDRAARNRAIVADLETEPVDVVARRYGLAPRTIRDIRQRAAAASYQGAGSNGSKGERRPPFTELGVSGLDYSHGYVDEEFLTPLRGSAQRYRAFNEMRQNSPVIAAGLLAVELSIRRVDWRLEGEDERAEFIDGARGDMSTTWDDHIADALTMIPFGFAPFEIVYKRRLGPLAEGAASQFDDGRIGWRKLAFRSQDSLDRWAFDEAGGLQAMIQRAAPDWAEHVIPIEKLVLYRTSREKGNPEGRSLLRPAYVPYYYAKNLASIEAIGAERDLTGLPVVYMAKTGDTASGKVDRTRAEELVRRVRADEQAGIVIPNPKDDPDGWAFELVSSPGQKQTDIGAIISRHERRMALAFLAQFLMLGMDQVGSYSLSSDHSDFFGMAIGALAESIAQTFSQYAIPRLLLLNGMRLDDPPTLRPGPVGTPELNHIGGFLANLVSSGVMVPDDDLEAWVRDMIDAPPVRVQGRGAGESDGGEAAGDDPPAEADTTR
ncbi:MAG: hypothetical protein P8Z40_10525 [Chloroflexota bacterium]